MRDILKGKPDLMSDFEAAGHSLISQLDEFKNITNGWVHNTYLQRLQNI